MHSDTRHTHTCPLCGHTAPSQNDVYVHLQLNHRKSEVCDALMEITDSEDESTEPFQQQQIPSSDD